MADKRHEIDANYEAFLKMLPSIKGEHLNKYALMRHGEVVNFYSTMQDAFATGEKFYDDGEYSVQKVTDAAIDLGYYSHAVYLG